MIRPRALKKGDTIGIIAPSGPVRIPENVDKAINFVKNMGFNVKEGKSIRKTYGFLAGSDEERLSDVNEMFLDEEVSGIFCIKGGYGTTRFASLLNSRVAINNPKVFLGYSDITSLHIVFNNAGLITFHGPMPSSDMIQEEYTEFSHTSLLEAITVKQGKREILNPKNYELNCLYEGKVTAPVVGGNLCLITRSLGTNYEIDTKGKILFIEDIDEEPYQIDAALCHLRNCGKLDDAVGFIIGDFNNSVAVKTNPSLNFDEVIRDLLVSTKKPVISNFRAGHCEPKITVALGAVHTLNATDRKITLEEEVLV